MLLHTKILLASTLWLASSQDADRVPSKLEDAIEIAMRNNPQILMAEAKMHQVEAEYKETRLRITQRVLEAYNRRKEKSYSISAVDKALTEARQLTQQGRLPQHEYIQKEADLVAAHNELAQIEAELKYLLGLDGIFAVKSGPANTPAAASADAVTRRPPVPSRFEPHLGTLVEVDFDATSLTETLQTLAAAVVAEQSTAFSIVINDYAMEEEFGSPEEITISLKMAKKVTLQQALTAIADLSSICFVIRDYGILVTHAQQAEKMYSATIPENIRLDKNALPR